MTIIDWRATADYSGLTRAANKGSARALFDKKGSVVLRDPAKVTGLCFHVTACLFGVSPAAIKKAGGDAIRARNERARRVPAHATVFRNGDAVVPFALRSYLYHGNGLNERTLGIEIESKDGTITREQRAALAELVPWLIEQAKLEGMTICEAWGHRQSNGNKPNDPGLEVWRDVVIPLSDLHGLTRPARAVAPPSKMIVKPGLPIPKAWDPLGV